MPEPLRFDMEIDRRTFRDSRGFSGWDYGRRRRLVGFRSMRHQTIHGNQEASVQMRFDANDRYEIKAIAFYRMMGCLAPGKDRPAVSGADDEEETQQMWRDWNTAYGKVIDGIFEATEKYTEAESADWKLVQVHDVTDGRHMLAQGGFYYSYDCLKWATDIQSEHKGRKLEVVEEGSPHFFVTNANPAASPQFALYPFQERVITELKGRHSILDKRTPGNKQ